MADAWPIPPPPKLKNELVVLITILPVTVPPVNVKSFETKFTLFSCKITLLILSELIFEIYWGVFILQLLDPFAIQIFDILPVSKIFSRFIFLWTWAACVKIH